MSATHLCWQEEPSLERMWWKLPKQTHRNLMSVPLPWLWGSTRSSLKFLWYWNLASCSELGLFSDFPPKLETSTYTHHHYSGSYYFLCGYILKKQTSPFSFGPHFFLCKKEMIVFNSNTAKILFGPECWLLSCQIFSTAPLSNELK